jgi:hypothetical protein
MIEASKTVGVACFLADDRRRPVPADVVHGADITILPANHYNRLSSRHCCPVIARLGYLALVTDEQPDLSEDVRHLFRKHPIIGKNTIIEKMGVGQVWFFESDVHFSSPTGPKLIRGHQTNKLWQTDIASSTRPKKCLQIEAGASSVVLQNMELELLTWLT